MPAWPATLPQQPVLTSPEYGSPLQAILRSEMSTGPAKTRPLVTDPLEPLSMTFEPLTTAQVATFKAFHRNTIKRGALSFTIPDPITSAVVTVRFASVEGHYKLRVKGRNYFSLSVDLEVFP